MTPFGILQGRLSPAPAGRPQAFPWVTWREEFALARTAGFATLEWLVTADRVGDNPLFSDPGVAQIRSVARAAGVTVSSVCADCFIPLPLVRASFGERRERVELLGRIVAQAAKLDARVVVLPLLEANAPATDAEAADVLRALAPVLAHAAAINVCVALESGWPGPRLAGLLGGATMPALGVCYDIGNAAAFGLTAAADLRALGGLVMGVHVKDRRHSGESVPLGDGDADLAGAFAALDALGYRGPAVLETPAGADPLRNASRNLAAARALASGAAAPS